jgi:hypothetical protein
MQAVVCSTLDSFWDFAFAMGSVGKFHPTDCMNCGLPYVRTYPETWGCKECEKLEVLKRYLLHEIFPLARRGGEWIPDLLASFLCFDCERGARKRFLWLALTERESIFGRRFTYWGNGWEGNISQTEDILDRILCFV